jgi:ribonuclease HII
MINAVVENQFKAQGLSAVAGVDEVGRGPLAGPVVAAACVVPNNQHLRQKLLAQVRDSKALKATARQELSEVILAECRVGFGEASVAEIDTLNIRQATHMAMLRALEGVAAQAVLVDGNDIPKALKLPAQSIIKGDATELCIACASIVAKVRRDALMAELSQAYPAYGWASNAGYGTAKHLLALHSFGITPHHRASFEPVKSMLKEAA